jgi:predicted GNAT family acetyltransferase
MNKPHWAVRHEPQRQRFEVQLNAHLAVAEYRLHQRADATVMELHHTVTPPELQGQGLAAALVRAALAHAQAQGWKVEPTCSYVRSYMDRHPETQGLRA